MDFNRHVEYATTVRLGRYFAFADMLDSDCGMVMMRLGHQHLNRLTSSPCFSIIVCLDSIDTKSGNSDQYAMLSVGSKSEL